MAISMSRRELPLAEEVNNDLSAWVGESVDAICYNMRSIVAINHGQLLIPVQSVHEYLHLTAMMQHVAFDELDFSIITRSAVGI